MTRQFSSSQWIGYSLLKVLLQNMHSALSVGARSPFISTFSFPSITQNLLQISNQQSNMENQRVVIREEITQPPIYGDVSITVDEPIKIQSQTFAFYTYSISGDDMHGPFAIRRRYKDFDLLRKKLSQRWQGIYIPPISGKRSQSNFMHVFKIIGNNDGRAEIKYAETRKRFLKYFSQGIAIRPYIFYCDLFQAFLRGNLDFQVAIKGCPDKQYTFLLQQYQNNFKTIMQLTQQMDIQAVLSVNESHLTQLRQGQENLNKIYEAIYRNVYARDEYIQQFNVCMGTILPEYEDKYFLSHIGNDRKKLILNKSEAFNLKLAEYKALTQVNPVELFLQLVAYEIRQTKAFIEAIEGRKSAQRKRDDLKEKIDSKQKQITNLVNGGFSFRSVFKSGTKDLQIKEMTMKLQILKNQLYCIEKMIVIMVVNTNYEIQQYKLRRGRQYGQLFKSVAQKEMAQLTVYMQLLGVSLQGQN